MPRPRLITFFALVSVHVALVTLGPLLSESLAPVAAGTVYLPLWSLSSIGLPVFGPAASGGWAGPNFLGWVLVAGLWSTLWWWLAAVVASLRK